LPYPTSFRLFGLINTIQDYYLVLLIVVVVGRVGEEAAVIFVGLSALFIEGELFVRDTDFGGAGGIPTRGPLGVMTGEAILFTIGMAAFDVGSVGLLRVTDGAGGESVPEVLRVLRVVVEGEVIGLDDEGIFLVVIEVSVRDLGFAPLLVRFVCGCLFPVLLLLLSFRASPRRLPELSLPLPRMLVILPRLTCFSTFIF